ncbi:mannose-P-dolichol utilization defect 1 protein, partial [Striga asiatica]
YCALAPTVLAGQIDPLLFEALYASRHAVFFCARIPQIWENFKNKSTGELSFITSFMNFGGSMVRVFTSLREKAPTSDLNELVVLMLSMKSSSLSSALVMTAEMVHFLGALFFSAMGYLLKEALKTLCGDVTTKPSCSGLSGDLNPENSFHDYSPSWVSSETCNLQSSVRARDKVHLFVNKMMIDNQVHVVGEGIWEEPKYIATITVRKRREDEEDCSSVAAGYSCYYDNFLGVKEQV